MHQINFKVQMSRLWDCPQSGICTRGQMSYGKLLRGVNVRGANVLCSCRGDTQVLCLVSRFCLEDNYYATETGL